jgi:hypothetical protein
VSQKGKINEREKGWVRKNIFEHIMAKIFPKLVENINLTVQQSQKVPRISIRKKNVCRPGTMAYIYGSSYLGGSSSSWFCD